MKKTIAICTIFMVGLTASLHADIIDEWTFDYPDGTGLGSALSLQGTTWGTDSGSNAVVFGAELQFQYDGVTASTFRNATPSQSAGTTTGQFQLSWTYTSIDFSLTHATSATNKGRIGFGLRSVTNVNEDAVLRIEAINDGITFQYADANNNFAPLTTLAGSQFTNIGIRLVYNLDDRGSAGSFKAYYSAEGSAEIALFENGTLQPTFQLDNMRMVQQTSNGGTSWIQGDTVRVDNLILETLTLEPEIIGYAVRSTTGIQFDSETGAVYALEYDEAGAPEEWLPAGIQKEGSGSTDVLFDPSGYSTSRTYRIISK